MLDASSGCLLLARASFSAAAKTDYEGLVSVQDTLPIIVVKKDGQNGPSVFKVSGAGGDEATATANCTKRLVEKWTGTSFPIMIRNYVGRHWPAKDTGGRTIRRTEAIWRSCFRDSC